MVRSVLLFTACWMTCGQSLIADEPDPRLQKIRDHWKSAPAEINSFRLRGRRFTYDRVFEVEKRAEFELAWERDGRLIFRIEGAEIPETVVSDRKTVRGKRYKLESDVAEIWYFPDREHLVQVIVDQNIATEVLIPPKPISPTESLFPDLSQSFRDAPEFLRSGFNPGLGRFALECEWKISHAESGHLFLKTTSVQRSSFSEIELYIREADSELVAVKIIDPTGYRETVYRFDEREANPGFAKDAPVFDIKRDQLKLTNDSKSKEPVEPKISTDSADNSPEEFYNRLEFSAACTRALLNPGRQEPAVQCLVRHSLRYFSQ